MWKWANKEKELLNKIKDCQTTDEEYRELVLELEFLHLKKNYGLMAILKQPINIVIIICWIVVAVMMLID